MLFPNKSYLTEKLNNQSISLNCEDQDSDSVSEFHLCESYTVNNIISNKTMVSNYEYSCIPSKSSFLFSENSSDNVSKYVYSPFNKNFPDDNLIWQPVIYTIKNMRETPYLLYLLKLNEIENEYDFINRLTKKVNSDESTTFLSQMLNLKIEYSGFITHNNINYLFFNCLDVSNQTNDYIWSSITEIVNYEKIYNTRINNSVKKLLLSNPDLINIYSLDKSSIYELPYVYYFLVEKLTNNILYCSNYTNALKMINNIDQKIKHKYHISRRIIFTGTIKCINKPDNNFNSNYYEKFDQYNSVYNFIEPELNEVCLFIELNDKISYLELSCIV